MDLKNISLFSSLGQKLEWLSERQKVLAQNIANANTPGYKPQDLKKVSFSTHLEQYNSSAKLQMARDDNEHLSANGTGSGHFEIREERSTFSETTPDGNAVNLEDELIKMGETQMDYTMAINLYKKHVGMMKTALGRR